MPDLHELWRLVCPTMTQRGNNRQDVFFVDDDRRGDLELLVDEAQRFELRVSDACAVH